VKPSSKKRKRGSWYITTDDRGKGRYCRAAEEKKEMKPNGRQLLLRGKKVLVLFSRG